ncbi:MAG: YraN family protein [Proteobacteria bacterium]|nr:YraN family protein [Pseudomonadota bacterium]
MKSRRHVAAQRRGRFAETLAAWRLRLAGWRIVERDLHLPAGQVDLVARRGRVLAFVEVKARATRDDAAESLHPAQRLRIARAAEIYLAKRPEFAAFDVRFDLVLVAPGRWPRHVKDAWRDSR